MAKYRKKPIVIEAVQLTPTNLEEIKVFAELGRLSHGNAQLEDGKRLKVFIPTLEGLMTANQEDWIIRGVAGELYPCKNDIFLATYDLVEGDLNDRR